MFAGCPEVTCASLESPVSQFFDIAIKGRAQSLLYGVSERAAHVCTSQGLPHQTVTWWFPMPSDFGRIILLAIKVCAIDVLESISIAKALAYRNQYDLKCAPAPTSLPALL